MLLTTIRLENFRSYSKRTFSFSPHLTIILGPNTSGKTNILEAIMLLATGKSFRASKDSEMISYEQEFARIVGNLGDDAVEVLVTTGTVGGKRVMPKKFLVNAVPRRMIDATGTLKAVLFWPEHLELITGSPGGRRRFLDTVLSQTDREYRRNLGSYERGIRQRNKLLYLINEGKATRSQLLFWDQLLCKAGGYITDERAAFISYVSAFVLAGVRYQLVYDKSVISESRLQEYAHEEIAAKATLVGPHRDDVLFMKRIDGEPSGTTDSWKLLAAYGSRGEQRLGVLWAKMAELTYIQEKTGDRPILLLDDIFSELDPEHQRLISTLIQSYQCVITSADPEDVARATSDVERVERIILD